MRNRGSSGSIDGQRKKIFAPGSLEGVLASVGSSWRKKVQQQKAVQGKTPRFLFKPDSVPRLSWDVFMMLAIMYFAFAVPIRLAFLNVWNNEGLEWFFTVCFFIDIGFNFNTALHGTGGLLITNRKEIAINYFQMWFWIDIIATFPFDLFLPSSSDDGGSGSVNKLGRLGKVFRLMRIFKLLRLLKLGRILRRLRHSTILNPNYMLLMRTVAVMGMVLHWTACGYWFIVENHPADPYERDAGDDAWMPPQYIRDSQAFGDQYGYAFFWSISVVTGAGWDIIPATGIEVFYSR
jgi:hyperpolarization activated cyclic nucleotide-gated potassium channel 2